MLTRLGVLGWPVAHSRSPAMHRAALEACGLRDWTYQKLPAPPEVFEEIVRALPAAGFVGANVTIPHKEAALALATDATDRARAIGAANTLTFGGDGAIHADNTDAPGLIAALPRDPRGATALVLGAGGSARAVVWALQQAGAEVRVWNRTPERAAGLGAPVVEGPAGEDLVVNCTAIGLAATDDPFKALPLDADALGEHDIVVDLVYGPHGTALLREAAAQGCSTVDGLEILVHQGALSFERWTGLEAPLHAMREGARGPTDDSGKPHSPPASPRS